MDLPHHFLHKSFAVVAVPICKHHSLKPQDSLIEIEGGGSGDTDGGEEYVRASVIAHGDAPLVSKVSRRLNGPSDEPESRASCERPRGQAIISLFDDFSLNE